MLARCQFWLYPDGRCGATFTYPIEGYPWRRNPKRTCEFQLSEAEKHLLFAEVHRLRTEHPADCLENFQLWSDHSEKANAITRDRDTNTLCYTIGIFLEGAEQEEYFAIRENSEAFLNSVLYTIVSRLIAPYEHHNSRATLA